MNSDDIRKVDVTGFGEYIISPFNKDRISGKYYDLALHKRVRYSDMDTSNIEKWYSKEIVNIPSDMYAVLTLKSKYNEDGYILISPKFKPSFKGKLSFTIDKTNVDKKLKLKEGDVICRVHFCEVSI